MKFGILGVAVALASASGAGAVTLNVTSVGAYHLGTFNVSGTTAGYGSFNRSEYGGPIVIQGTTDSGAPFSVITYCFDILHSISGGFGYQAPLNYTFTSEAFTTDQSTGPSTGNALTTTQIKNMSGLARLGASLFLAGGGDLDAQMPAIQAAIWSTEYGLTASNFSNSAAQGFYDGYLAMIFTARPTLGLTARNAAGQIVGGQQGLVVGDGITASVPEPMTWGLLVSGFALVGAAARRRRSIPAIAA